MPYITKEQVAEKRAAIRKAFPNFKISVRGKDYSSIHISILEGPIQLTENNEGYQHINHFYIKEHYKESPEIEKVLSGILEIANAGNGTQFVDGDYGAVPEFYVRMSVGDWDKPYKLISRVTTSNKKPLREKVSTSDRYPEGYLPKIQYWTSRMNEEAAKGNLKGVEFASNKVQYFTGQQKNLETV